MGYDGQKEIFSFKYVKFIFCEMLPISADCDKNKVASTTT